MFSSVKTPSGVANWEKFCSIGMRMGNPPQGIMLNWMLQACSRYMLNSSKGPMLRQIFMYAKFTEEQLEMAIRLCRDESFQQQLPEDRRRMLIENLRNHDFSGLHFRNSPHEEFVCDERSQADFSKNHKSETEQRTRQLERSFNYAEETARRESHRADEAEKRALVAERRAQLAESQAQLLTEQLARIHQTLSQLGELFQPTRKPVVPPSSVGHVNDEPQECIRDTTFEGEVMTDPVVAADGFTYERASILRWFAMGKQFSPTTGALLNSQSLFPNHTVKILINEWNARRVGVAAVGGGGSATGGYVGGGGGGVAAVGGGTDDWWRNDVWRVQSSPDREFPGRTF